MMRREIPEYAQDAERRTRFDRRAIYQLLRKSQDIKYSKFAEMLDKLGYEITINKK